MTPPKHASIRILWWFWLAAVVLWIAVVLYPVSTTLTRLGSLILLAVIWAGLLWLTWSRIRLRIITVGVTLIAVAYALAPARPVNSRTLTAEFIESLRRYQGVRYVWGGESFLGIDCSGLMRRGLIDAMALRGLRTFDGGMIRSAFSLWWHDQTAGELGDARSGVTTGRFKTESINATEPSRLLPGDLAANEVHILAYLGGNEWIEADPDAGKVVVVSVPSQDVWFNKPMRIVRWSVLAR